MQVHVNDTGTRLVNNEGDVAVLVSPGFGAGWYTWNRDEVDPFDPQLAQFVFEGKTKEAMEYAEQKWPEAYHGGLEQLVVYWVSPRTAFRFEEYDGSESLTFSYEDWITA